MSNNRLQDKVAIVTGAGTRGPMPGTGQATAILFARQGARVLLVDLENEPKKPGRRLRPRGDKPLSFRLM